MSEFIYRAIGELMLWSFGAVIGTALVAMFAAATIPAILLFITMCVTGSKEIEAEAALQLARIERP